MDITPLVILFTFEAPNGADVTCGILVADHEGHIMRHAAEADGYTTAWLLGPSGVWSELMKCECPNGFDANDAIYAAMEAREIPTAGFEARWFEERGLTRPA